jgi:hypothetical protein
MIDDEKTALNLASSNKHEHIVSYLQTGASQEAK